MGSTIVLVPLIITAWPMIAASVTAAAVSAGFHVMKVVKKQKKTESIDLTMDNMDVVAESLAHDDKITVAREGVEVTFSRDAQGHFKTCVEGNLARDELKKIGEDLAGRVIQSYIHKRLSQELQNHGFVTLEEDKGPEDTIRLTVRRYEE
ncbi:MAG: hypothetical protein NTY46_14400 [Candidatus Sumerlaeota bacterium]|nr:hypothetical protein [Candidatus Sumerlaeota bacterium]